MSFIRKVEKQSAGITYGEILDNFVLLEQVQGLTGEKLCFARRKNLMRLRAFERMNSMETRIPMSESFRKFQKEAANLKGKYLLTDRKGKTVMRETVLLNGSIDLQPVVDAANKAFIAEMDALLAKYKTAIQEREDDLKAYREFLQEAVPLDELPEFHKVNMSEVSGLNQQQADAVVWFIKG